MALPLRQTIQRIALILTMAVVAVGAAVHSAPAAHAAGKARPPCLPCPMAPAKAPSR